MFRIILALILCLVPLNSVAQSLDNKHADDSKASSIRYHRIDRIYEEELNENKSSFFLRNVDQNWQVVINLEDNNKKLDCHMAPTFDSKDSGKVIGFVFSCTNKLVPIVAPAAK